MRETCPACNGVGSRIYKIGHSRFAEPECLRCGGRGFLHASAGMVTLPRRDEAKA